MLPSILFGSSSLREDFTFPPLVSFSLSQVFCCLHRSANAGIYQKKTTRLMYILSLKNMLQLNSCNPPPPPITFMAPSRGPISITFPVPFQNYQSYTPSCNFYLTCMYMLPVPTILGRLTQVDCCFMPMFFIVCIYPL